MQTQETAPIFIRPGKGLLTDSAYFATKQLLRRAGVWQHMEAFVASGLTPEQVRDWIAWRTRLDNGPKGEVNVPAGLIEPVMAKIARRLKRERGPLNLNVDDTIDDFQRDKLGVALARKQCEAMRPRTDLYRLITQEV